MPTFTDVLGRCRVEVPPDLAADAEVPVTSEPQRQGDVIIVPQQAIPMHLPDPIAVPPEGIAIVRGEATGNTHMLHVDGAAHWWPHDATDPSDVLLGHLTVGDDATAWLIH